MPGASAIVANAIQGLDVWAFSVPVFVPFLLPFRSLQLIAVGVVAAACCLAKGDHLFSYSGVSFEAVEMLHDPALHPGREHIHQKCSPNLRAELFFVISLQC